MATSSDLKYEYRVTNIGLAGADTFNVTLMATNETTVPGGYAAGVAPGTGNFTLVVDKDTAKNILPGDVYTITLAKK